MNPANAAVAASSELTPSARSCLTCAKAKAKCIRRSESGKCERCDRLRKDCLTREPTTRRRKASKITRSAQLEKLESKLENLVIALSAQQGQRRASESGQSSPGESQPASESNRATTIVASACSMGDDDLELPPGLDANTAYQSGYGSNSEENVALFERYRRMMAIYMPFVVIPDDMTAAEMLETKPLLSHAIGVVACFHNQARQHMMAKALMKRISESMLINNEKSLDILQAILVFLAWYHQHIFFNQQITNLGHLAMALTVDLSINREPMANDKQKLMSAAKSGPGQCHATHLTTNEERRAVLGTYYLTSVIAASFKKSDAMKYSKWLESCMSTLELQKEYESDTAMVHMVRLQHLTEDMHNIEAVPGASRSMYIKSFFNDIATITTASSYDSNNFMLAIHKTIAEISVWELSFLDISERKSPANAIRSRLDDMYQCVKACATFANRYEIPTSAYLTLPFAAFAQMSYCLMVIVKLAMLDAEGWDIRMFKDELDIPYLIETTARRWEEVGSTEIDGMKVNNDSFRRWSSKVRFLGQMLAMKSGQENGGNPAVLNALPPDGHSTLYCNDPSASIHVPVVQQQPTPPEEFLSGDFFHYLDEKFWESFTGDLDFSDLGMVP